MNRILHFALRATVLACAASSVASTASFGKTVTCTQAASTSAAWLYTKWDAKSDTVKDANFRVTLVNIGADAVSNQKPALVGNETAIELVLLSKSDSGTFYYSEKTPASGVVLWAYFPADQFTKKDIVFAMKAYQLGNPSTFTTIFDCG